MSKLLSIIIIGGAMLQPRVESLNPIVTKGNLLYDSVTQERFYIKGVTYDPIPGCDLGISLDVLADDYVYPGGEYGSEWVSWREDLEEMTKLHINTVRIYTVDQSKTHANFMQRAEELGLYVIMPLTGSDVGVLDALKSSPECYAGQLGRDLLHYSRSILKQFSEYPNMLLFEAGNELLNIYSNAGNGESFPCLKALIRDLHVYQTGCASSMRRVPLVYSAEDLGSPTRKLVGDFLTSRFESDDDVLDVMGINTYTYCKDFHPWDTDNPYFQLNEIYKNYASPVVFTEFGCPEGEEAVNGRAFNMVAQMMNEMQETISGGLVYELVSHPKPFYAPGFGLITTKATACSDEAQTTWLPDAYQLQINYDSSAYHSFDNRHGDWTDADRCSWKPPTLLQHRRPPVPDVSILDPASVTWSFANWNDPLPPMPDEDPLVTCPSFTLTETERKENACFSDPTPPPTMLPSISLSPTRPSSFPTDIPSPPPTHAPHDERSAARFVVQQTALNPSPSRTHVDTTTGITRAALVEVTVLIFLAVSLVSTGVALFLKRRRELSKEAESVVTELARTHKNAGGDRGQTSQKVISHDGQDIYMTSLDVVSPFHSSTIVEEEEGVRQPGSFHLKIDDENEMRPAWQPEVSGFYV